MKYDDNIKSSTTILDSFFSGLVSGKLQEFSIFDKGWQKVLLDIKKDGEKLASHSSIKELKNGFLYIETDHPGWIQLLQFNKRRILRALSKEFPAVEVKDIFFSVKGI